MFDVHFGAGKMSSYQPGDRVKDSAGNHFVIEFDGDFVSVEVARRQGFEIVDRAAYGAIERAAPRLAYLYLKLSPQAYNTVFTLVLETIGCEAVTLARAVVRERRR